MPFQPPHNLLGQAMDNLAARCGFPTDKLADRTRCGATAKKSPTLHQQHARTGSGGRHRCNGTGHAAAADQDIDSTTSRESHVPIHFVRYAHFCAFIA